MKHIIAATDLDDYKRLYLVNHRTYLSWTLSKGLATVWDSEQEAKDFIESVKNSVDTDFKNTFNMCGQHKAISC